MRARTFVSLLPLGAALLSAVTASSAQAQPGLALTVCRDRAQVASRNARACAGHGGVDIRATQVARQYNRDAYSRAGQYGNRPYDANSRVGQYGNRPYDANGRSDRDARRRDVEHRGVVESDGADRRESRRDRPRDDRRPD